jgi:hypothetical protein
MFIFESFTTATRVDLKIPVNVTTFGCIGRIVGELGLVESQRKQSRLPPPSVSLLKCRGYELISLEVRSPPAVSVLADPSWLAVYIGLLALGVSCLQLLGSYSSIKSGAKELANDLDRLKDITKAEIKKEIDAIRQLTDAQRRDLAIGTNLFIDDAQRTGEEIERLLLRAVRFASVLRRNNTSPTIDVSVDKNRPSDGQPTNPPDAAR